VEAEVPGCWLGGAFEAVAHGGHGLRVAGPGEGHRVIAVVTVEAGVGGESLSTRSSSSSRVTSGPEAVGNAGRQ